MKASGQLQYDLPDDDSPVPVLAPKPGEKIVSVQNAGNIASVSHHATAGAHGHDPHSQVDADVQEYMNRLLNRSGSDKPAPISIPSQTTKGLAEPATTSATAVPALTPEEYVPKAVAPEKHTNLNALREVANHQARSAIETSAKQEHKALTLTYLALTVAALGFGILFFSMSAETFDLSMFAGLGAFGTAIYPMLKFVEARNSKNSSSNAKQ
jgi:hypothetical protein